MKEKNSTSRQPEIPERQPHRVRLPVFLIEEEIGLGDGGSGGASGGTGGGGFPQVHCGTCIKVGPHIGQKLCTIPGRGSYYGAC